MHRMTLKGGDGIRGVKKTIDAVVSQEWNDVGKEPRRLLCLLPAAVPYVDDYVVCLGLVF